MPNAHLSSSQQSESTPVNRGSLTLIDASGFIHRAFHALPPLSTPEGHSVGAVVGFAHMILRWQERHHPTHGVLVFDHGRSVLRQNIFPPYKAHRPPTPPELAQQFPWIKDFCKALNMPILEIPGVEADDILASITHHVVSQGWSVDVVTSDKDLFQISGPQVTMHDPLKQRVLDEAGVRDLWGVNPHQIPHVQALAGDSADGIPGVPGIGIKTATAWIQEFESIEGLIAGVDRLKSPQKRALVKEYTPQIRLYYQLTLLERTHWKEDWDPQGWRWPKEADQVALHAFLKKFSLKTLADRLKRRGILRPEGTDLFSCPSQGPLGEEESLQEPFTSPRIASPCLGSTTGGKVGEDPSPYPSQKTPYEEISWGTCQESQGIEEFHTCQTDAGDPDGQGVTHGEPDKNLEPAPLSLEGSPVDSFLEPSHPATRVHALPSIGMETFYEVSSHVWEKILEAGAVALIYEARPREGDLFKASEGTLDEWIVTAAWGQEGHWGTLDQEGLQKVFQDKSCIKIVHDGKQWLHTFGIFDFSPEGGKGQASQKSNESQKSKGKENPFLEGEGSTKSGTSSRLRGAHLIPVESMGPLDDVMLLSYLLRGSKVKHHLVSIFTAMGWTQEECVLWNAAQRARAMLHVWEKNLRELVEKRLMGVYYTLDRPLMAVLAKMEHHGIGMDRAGLWHLEREWEGQRDALSQEIMRRAGGVFNLASPKQLGKVLFEDLGWPTGKKGKSGAYHTDNDVLRNLASRGYDLALGIMEWRQLNTLINTYARGLREHIDPETQGLHTTYSMVTTLTGRLSSLEPNLQNIPIRTPQGRLLRQQFCAPEGYGFLSLDYSQIELRLLAHMGPVPSLQRAFEDKVDVHTQTAAHLFGCALSEVTQDMRRRAKGINFGILYGISAFGLAQHLDIDRPLAKKMIHRYFETYPEIEDYLQRTKDMAHAQGYVTTLWGRRCFLEGAQSSHGGKRGAAERQAINAPLQGTSADIIKKAMIEAEAWITQSGYDVALVLQIHDELVFQVLTEHVQFVRSHLVALMEGVSTVPLVVTSSFGHFLN